MNTVKIKIDGELAGLIPPPTDEERQQLEANILADGCRDPLAVWAEEDILLDGHNRYRICQQHDVPFEMRKVSLPDRDAAKLWIEENQLGRRNLTDDQRAAIAFRIQQRRCGTKTQGPQLNAECRALSAATPL